MQPVVKPFVVAAYTLPAVAPAVVAGPAGPSVDTRQLALRLSNSSSSHQTFALKKQYQVMQGQHLINRPTISRIKPIAPNDAGIGPKHMEGVAFKLQFMVSN